MKTNIDELSEAEALALTPDQIEFLIKYSCAEEGIRWLPEPVKPEPFKADFDLEVFEVHGMYFCDHLTAEVVKNVLNDNANQMRKLDYDWQKGSQYKFASEGSYSFSVEKVRCFTPERYAKVGADMQRLEADKRKYETLLKEYQEEQKKMQRVKDYIYEKLDEHRSRAYTRERSCNDYREYLKLANGDIETARRFFEKAYPGANHQEVYGLVAND